MPGTDDLAPLLVGQGSNDVGFRQGVVIAWDETTGTNTIDVGGAMLVDLPALNIGDFVHLAEGDVVGLLRFKTSYFILGRVILPRAPDPNRASIDFESRASQISNFAITTTLATKTSVDLAPPDWVDEAAIMVGQVGQGVNFGATVQDYLVVQPYVNGTALAGQVGGAGNGGGSGFASTVGTTVISGPFNGSITVDGRVGSQFSSWGPANASNSTSISVMALYRRIN